MSRRIHSECGKIRTRKTPNTDTFHTVYIKVLLLVSFLEAEIFKLGKTYRIPSTIFLRVILDLLGVVLALATILASFSVIDEYKK